MAGPDKQNGMGTGTDRQQRSAAVNLGLNFAVGIALLTYVGHWLDARRGGGSGWTLTGMFLGLVYGAYETWKVVRHPGNGTGGPKPG
ncbi:MAG: AtpZ/AtpI family protein [Lentisphaerae bacterium]|nr:AtpZ/AtpI family protein [Lentisphaerota bacterium]